MRNIIRFVIAFILVSCHNTPVKDEIKEEGKQICKVLNLPDSTLNRYGSVNEIRRTNIDGKLKLTEIQKKMLFDMNSDDINGNAYLFNIEKVYKDVFLLFVLVENISNEKFYVLTVDCSTKKLDYLYLTECDYFDVIAQNENSETGLFIVKYFHLLNDTTISTRSIFKEETKDLNDGLVLKYQIDSITHDYIINRSGKFELIHGDSVRTNPIRIK